MKKALSLVSTLLAGVVTVVAQGGIVNPSVATTNPVNAGPLTSLLAAAQGIVEDLVPFAVGLAVVVFFWYLIKFIVKGNDSAEEKSLSLKGMGYSILAIFVMVSIWGIIGLMGSMLGVGQGGGVPVPGVPVPR